MNKQLLNLRENKGKKQDFLKDKIKDVIFVRC